MMNENPRIVDISYTVKESVAAGRQLMKNLDTGEEFWATDSDTEIIEALAPVKKPRGKKTK
jgi:hypothetical protein